MKLWLVRHPPVQAAAGLCYGITDLPVLADELSVQAERLSPLLPVAAVVWSSPLSRCRALAEALSQRRPDLGLRVDERLREMDFGDWEGQRWDAIAQPEYSAWLADFAHHRVGGGESAQQVIDRVASALDEARASASAAPVWITHAGVIRSVHLLLQGRRRIERASQWPREAPAMGHWWVVDA
jgi:alpha-ribazole phosphatase